MSPFYHDRIKTVTRPGAIDIARNRDAAEGGGRVGGAEGLAEARAAHGREDLPVLVGGGDGPQRRDGPAGGQEGEPAPLAPGPDDRDDRRDQEEEKKGGVHQRQGQIDLEGHGDDPSLSPVSLLVHRSRHRHESFRDDSCRCLGERVFRQEEG